MNNSSPITVSELTKRIKGALEASFTNVSIEGEISNFKRHSSGHLYFTLKDEGAQISAVMWRGRTSALFFTPLDGMKVIARGNITLYEVRGQYQIDVYQLQPLGVGELQLAFEKLKQKLLAEGMFNREHKKPIPAYPERIGVVTSSTGAALKDILNILNRRYPLVEVILLAVKVQGEGAAEEVASAIDAFNKYGKIDVMIVGRGGGSLEDLWAFNEEIVARAIYASKIPVISAVGHEVDYTISDFVADLRAPTPSAAAELVVKSKSEIIDNLRNYCYNIEQSVENAIESNRDRIESYLSSYSFNRPVDMIRQFSQRLDELLHHMRQTSAHLLTLNKEKLYSLDKRISSINPESVLKRGYTIVYRGSSVVEKSKNLHPEDDVRIHFHDGEVSAKIN